MMIPDKDGIHTMTTIAKPKRSYEKPVVAKSSVRLQAATAVTVITVTPA
jgi:hypothetical protein